MAAHYKANKDQYAARHRQRTQSEKGKEARRRARMRWRKAHPEKWRAICQRYRAKKRGEAAAPTTYPCIICDKSFSKLAQFDAHYSDVHGNV